MLRSFPFCWLLGGKASTTYLGLSLASTFKSPIVWDVVEERFNRRLVLWKRQYLARGGRLTLLENTLCSLPIYLFCVSFCHS